MQTPELLALLENLFNDAAHSEVVDVKQVPGNKHKPAGLAVKFVDGSGGNLVVLPANGWGA